MLSSPFVLFTPSLRSHLRSSHNFFLYYLQTCTLTRPSLSSHWPSPQHPPPFLLLSCKFLALRFSGQLLLKSGYHRSRGSEQQARADNDERASIFSSGLGKGIGGLLKSVGINAALGAIPVAIENFLDGNSTRRALSDDEKRDPGVASLFGDLLKSLKKDVGIGKVLGNDILGGLTSGGAALGVGEFLKNTR